MTDPYKPAPSPLADPGAGAAAAPLGSQIAPVPGIGNQEPFKVPGGPASGHNEFQGEAPWDTLGRMLFSENSGSALGGVPGLGAVGRWAGEATGVGVGTVQKVASDVLGHLPAPGHVLDNAGLGTDLNSVVKPFDPKYDPTQAGGAKSALQLFVDLRNENGSGNMARQFQVVGQWMQKYDPQAFKDWQTTLGKAQAETFGAKGAEYISNFLSQWGTTYADLTPGGVQDGYLDTAPELYFGGSGSLGQGLGRDLAYVFNLQRLAERGAASVGGTGGGLLAGHNAPVVGEEDHGSRLNGIIFDARNNPSALTDIEKAVYQGMDQLGWTDKHAYNFLIDHGQGYSHDALTEVLLSFALDPIGVAAMGAGEAAQVGSRVGLYANTADSASRIGALTKAGARQIGTTVADVRAHPVFGPIAKIARTMVDPFSALPGAHGQAMVDTFSAAGVEGTSKGFGIGAVTNAARRSDGWGARAVFDQAWAVSALNMTRKWVVAGIVDDLAHTVGTSARRTIDEDLIQHVGKSGAKDSVTRIAAFAMKNREFWLSNVGVQALAERIAKVTTQSVDDVRTALASMSRDEQSVWHQASYSHAWGQFKETVAGILPDEWGKLEKKLPDMVIMNPQELDSIAAQELRAAIEGSKSLKEQTRLWSEAANRYEKIDAIGRITTGGKAQMKRYLNALDSMIEQGHLHAAATEQEIAGMPKAFQDQFLAAWTDSTGKPMWRIGFKPMAEQATGLVYDKSGKLVAWYAPSVDNVAQAAEVLPRRSQPLTDILGRAAQATPIGRAATVAKDSLDVAVQTALDRVSGDRIITGMEQNFRRSMRDAGYSDKVARNTFRLARDAAQENGFTLAGMNPEEFWRATKSELGTIVDRRVAKREVFSMLAEASGGDMRLLGVSSWMTQRIRSGLIARGLDPNNYLGAVTVKLYNSLRYALNPTFFLQAEFDAPWFNMYRGIVPLGGKAPLPGSAIWEMERITNAMGHTGLSRDLAMDFTERTTTIGWQEGVRDGIEAMPGVKGGFSRFKQWSGRMILNNELAYMNTKIGDAVFDALDHVRTVVDDKIANATSDAERLAWQDVRFDQVPMMEWLHQDFIDRIGRVPTREELGRDYLSQMIDDSLLEVRTPEGLLNYKHVNSKGEYHKPADIGDIRPLDLEYGVQSLHLPNVTNVEQLKTALATGDVMIGDVKDIMLKEGFHRDAVKRFVTAIKFNWRTYFDGMAHELGMSRYEMQGIEDMVTRHARDAGMTNVEYLTQVMPMTTGKKAAKEYASQGRIVTPAEMANLQTRGRELLNVPGAKNPVDLQAAVDTVAGELHQRTALTEWGGATYSPRTGQFIETANPWMHHGSNPRFAESIGKSGITRGDWTNRLEEAANYAKTQSGKTGESVVYRARAFNLKGGQEKAAGWLSGSRVSPQDLQVSVDGGQTWVDMVEGSGAGDGPWVSAVGNTTSISIKAAQDPAAFKAALDQFVADNADELQKPGMYVGTFRDEKIGKVQFDVARATFSASDTEAVQAAAGRTGGAYNVSTGNGLFAPTLEPMASVDAYLKFTLDTMRAVEKGEAGLDDITKLVTNHLQPSMKARLLDHFAAGLDAQIAGLETAGPSAALRDLRDLKANFQAGAWGPEADKMYRDLVVKRAGGANGEVVSHAPFQYPSGTQGKAALPKGFAHESLPSGSPAYHQGDLGFGRDTTLDRMTPGRGTGHFGTGVYFTSEADPVLDLTKSSARADRPSQIADLSGYNLYTPKTSADAFALHDALKLVNDLKPEAQAALKRIFPKISDTAVADAVARSAGGTDSVSTIVMKDLGFEGVDVRHLPQLDNTMYGTVVYTDKVPAAPQYVYRVESANVAGSGWPERTGVSIKANPMYAKDDLSTIYRAKVPGDQLEVGRHGAGGDDRLLAADVPPEQIEFFGNDGKWHPAPTLIPDAEVERGARYFSQYLQSINPKMIAGETLRAITEHIPVEGASAHDFTQALLAHTLRENFRLAESDAIRLAHIQPNRSVLERSLNHPFFAMYPSSYFWGKVIPETFKFVALEPFGMKTTLGTYGYLKTKQTIELQSMYDARMGELWKTLGKSAVVSLLSYLSPSMPWEDMASNLPPWVRSLAKGDDFNAMLRKELDTVSPERWVSHFTDAAGEVGDAGGGIINGLTQPQQKGLETIAQPTGPVSEPANPFNLPGQPGAYAPSGPVKATGLAPILSSEMAELDKVLSGR